MEPYLGVFGHTALDIILRVPSRPKIDSSVAIDERVVRWGGTAANISRICAEMGAEVSLCSFVGEDFPKDYLDALKSSGVRTYDLREKEGHDTPRCWIVTDRQGKEFTLIDQGAMKEMGKFDIAERTVEECEILHIGTGRPEHYEKVYESVDLDEKTIAFDPAQELEYVYDADTFTSFLERSDLFFCNEKEKQGALSYTDESSIEGMLENFGLDLVLVTKGSSGSTAFLPRERIDIPPYEPDEVVEATGAGDAFRAGFYAALYRDYPLEDCCRIGAARASFALEHVGSQENLVGWDEVILRFEKQN
ncbi:MAG: carbohydrate kinase family protein [Candidatus Thermoplasmatota archaeon]